MADAHRDFLLPPGWIPGAMIRLTEGVRRCEDGALRVNPHGFVHRINDGPSDGTHRRHLRRTDVWFDATAEHRITGIYCDREWTAVQFCPAPGRRPYVKVWTNVGHRNHWWAEIVNDRAN